MAGEPTHVIDACVLIQLFKKENGHQMVENVLTDERNVSVIHGVNLCEVYYDYLKSDGLDAANTAWTKATQIVRVVSPMEENFLKMVGQWKTQYRGFLSLGDSFAAALANLHNCPLVTKDHASFDPVATANALKIFWT